MSFAKTDLSSTLRRISRKITKSHQVLSSWNGSGRIKAGDSADLSKQPGMLKRAWGTEEMGALECGASSQSMNREGPSTSESNSYSNVEPFEKVPNEHFS